MTRIALAAACLCASVAFAQTKAVEDAKAVAVDEIERGFFFEVRGGFWSIANPPSRDGGPSYFSPGVTMQVDMGVDLGERVSTSLFLLVATNPMKIDYTGLSENGTASGDFSTLAPGAQVKVRLVGFEDGQDVKRTWIYARAGGAVVFYNPTALLPTLDVLASAGPGIEYFTRLRHFSIGVEANVNVMVLTRAVGFSIVPTVKYAF
jgi:hypothetical protein